jgi:hypothetical protein
MASAVLYTLHLIRRLSFPAERQVLEPIKMSHGQLKAVPSRRRTSFRHCCFLFLFCLLLCALAGDYSLSLQGIISYQVNALQDGELDQISMPSALKGKQVA